MTVPYKLLARCIIISIYNSSIILLVSFIVKYIYLFIFERIPFLNTYVKCNHGKRYVGLARFMFSPHRCVLFWETLVTAGIILSIGNQCVDFFGTLLEITINHTTIPILLLTFRTSGFKVLILIYENMFMKGDFISFGGDKYVVKSLNWGHINLTCLSSNASLMIPTSVILKEKIFIHPKCPTCFTD